MVTLRQRPTVATTEPEPVLEKEGPCVDNSTTLVEDESPSDSAVKHLRERWELASVLNFFNVFGPLVLEKLKLTAEEIEMGLIESNSTNAQLHIALLKGIPPLNKSLEEGDAWITVLCKKLEPWWPSIANGEIPVTANKGEEISEYKGLDPTDRLQFLKALCELRALQDDVRAYIQENAKEGAMDPRFCKRKLGGDGKKTSYWFDGNDNLGYRLYKVVNDTSKRAKAKKNVSDTSGFFWETEATNLDEFQRVARELSSSKSLAATGEMIETDAIPIVEKHHKKKEMAIKRKMKQEMAASVIFSRPIRSTRSCRNRTPAKYTFEEYDRLITEAVKETNKTKKVEEVEEEEVEEEEEQQSASLVDANDSSEDNKMNSTEDVPETEEEAPESGIDEVKEIEKSKEDSEGKIEFGAKNRLRQRLTRNSALC